MEGPRVGKGEGRGRSGGGYGTAVEFLSGNSQVDCKMGRRERKVLSGMDFVRMAQYWLSWNKIVHKNLVSPHCQYISSIMHLL